MKLARISEDNLTICQIDSWDVYFEIFKKYIFLIFQKNYKKHILVFSKKNTTRFGKL